MPGHLYGLRSWAVRGSGRGARLTATYVDATWPKGGKTYDASCTHDQDHEAPDSGCSCGIYAYHANARGAAALGGVRNGHVVGVIESWGVVELHADGFRAQHARIRLLLAEPGRSRRDLERIAQNHGAEVFEGSLGDLVDHCRTEGLGMDDRTVAELLAAQIRAEDERRRRVARRERWSARAIATVVIGVVAAALWQTAAHWDGISASLSGPPPAPPPAADRDLRILRQDLVTYDDDSAVLVLLVRNENPRLTAFGVYATGEVTDSDEYVVATPDYRFDQEYRPSLAPGQTGVLLDDIADADGDEDAARRFDIRLHARTYRRELPRAPVLVDDLQVQRSTCVAYASVRSDRARLAADALVLQRSRTGRIVDLWRETIGPLRRGAQRQAVTRVAPRTCLSRTSRLEAYAVTTPQQLNRRRP